MSFLDLDEWLIELAKMADLVFTPLADVKVFPENVDVTLVEGAVANEDHFHFIQLVRARSRVLVAFGDCAVTGNVTALRNTLGSAREVLERGYVELADVHPQIPSERDVVPCLLERVRPLHQMVAVDFYLPGCPPPAERIRAVLESMLQGKQPHLEGRDVKFG
jgi:NAD-reducing hydrogenase small subunit